MDRRNRFSALGSHDWISELILVVIYVAESALLWLLIASIVAIGHDVSMALSPWIVFALIVFSSTVPRVLDYFSVWEPWYQLCIGAAILVSVIVTTHALSFSAEPMLTFTWIREALNGLIVRANAGTQPVWASIVIVAAVWWRSRIRETPSIDSSYQFLRAGFGIAIVGVSIFALSSQRAAQDGAAAAVLVFFTCAVAAVGLCRAVSADRLGYERLTPKSLGVALIPSVATAIGAILLAGLFTRDLLDTFFWAMGPLLWVIGLALQGIVLLIAVIVLILLSPFIYLLRGHTPSFQSIRLNTEPVFVKSDPSDPAGRFDLLPDPIRYVLAAVVLLLIFGGITKFVLRGKSNKLSSTEDLDRERMRPIFDLRAALASLFGAFGFGSKDVDDDPLAHLRGESRWQYTIAIRETYTGFLEWSYRKGVARTDAVTPFEHAESVRSIARKDELDELVLVYNSARYGKRPATGDEAERARNAWLTLQNTTKADS